ncbi:hypothetical protein TRFO_29435 [Tritrichomonas foetus]|uniref:Uncharacterized protein n=1 Tax=Tritrichomonas foetus TaxID=1144522 RepID=A0A1J4JX48_9EUKA|nr:hypothetical protein TRFO_29435 [Tritrichomonas foetus]|eukprot:OHT03242.1 hypothetical protein TRFO_29435 [Tritrichomonas foetus]
MESVPPERLLSTTEVDALTLVFYFILKLPSLDYSNKDEIEKDAFSLCKGMAAFYATTDIVQIAHHQIWVSLPAGEEPSTDYNPKTISTIFKFNTMFDAALGNVLSKRIVKDCLKRIVSFFMYFPKHHKEIFMIVLKYLRSLAKVNPSGRTESIIPMLLALQKDTKKSNGESSMILHTFIMCAMIDAVEDTAPPVQKYVKKVVDLRLNANPPMADVDAPFFKEYFPDFKKPKKSKKDKKKDKKKGDKNKDGDNEEKQEMVYFKKKKLMNTFIDLKNRSSVFRLITDLGNTEFDDDAEEDEENIEDEPEDEGNDVQLIYQIGESDDNSAEDQSAGNENNGESEEEKEKKRKKAYKYIEKLEYKWNSSISSLPA